LNRGASFVFQVVSALVPGFRQIAGNIETFSYMLGYGLAAAASTLVGQHIGAKLEKEAYTYGMLTTYIAMLFMSIIGVLLFFPFSLACYLVYNR